jgi:hypothetical protein
MEMAQEKMTVLGDLRSGHDNLLNEQFSSTALNPE